MRSIQDIYEILNNTPNILIGAGSGLSTAAGLQYSGKRFTENFSDYIKKYQISDMYSAGFYPYPTLEEKWGYFSRHIKLNRYDAKAGTVYLKLLKLIANKNYFVITTNVDAQFEKAGFDTERLFATQGDYGKFQCETACHQTLYNNRNTITKMVEQQSDCKVPSELLPKCPVCNGNLVAHLRVDNNFIENEEWKAANKKYSDFIQSVRDRELVLLELGVGFNTPTIIRIPFEKMAAQWQKTTLIRINQNDVQVLKPEAEKKSIIADIPIERFLSIT